MLRFSRNLIRNQVTQYGSRRVKFNCFYLFSCDLTSAGQLLFSVKTVSHWVASSLPCGCIMRDKNKMNLSFAGCGFLGIYHVGVASCFREYAPHVLVDKIAGASVGSIAACALICKVPMGEVTTSILRVAVKARSRALGPLHPTFALNELIREGLESLLPENAHILCSGRLFISVTRYPDRENILLSQFNSREELVQAVLCSCFIPLYSGIMLPKFRGTCYFDGGFSNNLPVLDENTITISPFAGEQDICPQDNCCSVLQFTLSNTSIAVSPTNMFRVYSILFPPDPEILSKMCQQGFDDGLKYLQRHQIIACTRCLAVQSSLTFCETDGNDLEGNASSESDNEHTFDDCAECRYKRKMALIDSLPESVVKAIQDACDQVNKGVINWLFRHRSMKLLSWLGLPYVLPVDISIIIFCKIWQMMPMFQKELRAKFKAVLALIKSLLKIIDSNKHLCYATFSCQLAITEFDYTEESITPSYSTPTPPVIIAPQETCKLAAEPQVATEHVENPPADSSAQHLNIPLQNVPADGRPSQRKSYAGFASAPTVQSTSTPRRKSMVEMYQPERIVRNMKFNFTMDVTPSVVVNNKKKHMIQALKTLGEDNECDVLEFTNQALNWERECINHCQNDMEPEKAETLGQILECTSNEAFMAYYYVDKNKTLKVTEIYNVDDADTSAVLSPEEREVNQNLQWDSDWISPLDETDSYHDEPPCAITDTLEDKEFDMSDGESDHETEPSEEGDIFKEIKSNISQVSENVQTTTPKRKMSFIVVNK